MGTVCTVYTLKSQRYLKEIKVSNDDKNLFPLSVVRNRWHCPIHNGTQALSDQVLIKFQCL